MALDHFSVTRNTTKTVLNKNGVLETVPANVPAFEFNPDGTFKGCLIEPNATNLVLRSEEFDDAYWTKTQLNTSGSPAWVNVAEAPDGTMTAEKIIPNTQNVQHDIRRSATAPSQGTYTLSCFFKANGYNFIQMGLSASFIGVNLQTGDFVSDSAVNPSVIKYPNGWYRVSTSIERNASDSISPIFLVTSVLSATSTGRIFAGDNESGILIWGAQLEAGSVATSYIPTTDSTATRNADVIEKTGASGLIGQTEGTIYIEVDNTRPVTGTGTGRSLMAINNFFFSFLGGQNGIDVGRAGAGNFITVFNQIVQGKIKLAFVYFGTTIQLYVNGVKVGEQTSATLPTFTGDLYLGNRADGLRSFNDAIQVFSHKKTAWTEAEAINKTTL